MDILTHTISGAFAGVLVGSYFNLSIVDKLKVVSLGAIAGFLPDIDTITMWSGFDNRFGKIFNLKQSGRDIYSDRLWYSHHSLSHSFTIIFIYLSLFLIFTKKLQYFFTFSLGYTLHLLEDLPTPDRIWGGVRLFYPFESYYGGYGLVWWWNNYDIFLTISTLFVLSLILFFIKIKRLNIIIISLFLLTTFIVFIQIISKDVNFKYTTSEEHKILEQKSLQIQKEILGRTLFDIMQKFDKKIRIPF